MHLGVFIHGGRNLKITSDGFGFLTEVDGKALLLNVMNQDLSHF